MTDIALAIAIAIAVVIAIVTVVVTFFFPAVYQVLDSKAKLSCVLKGVAEGSQEKRSLKFLPRAIKSNTASGNRQNGGPILGRLSGNCRNLY